jgi:uncharacterized protein YukE
MRLFFKLFSFGPISNIGLAVLAIWALFSIYYLTKLFRKGPNEVILDLANLIPSIFTSIGVLFTFVGIFKGLYDFDVNHIDRSIPFLLKGLKTAFLTSILGLILSILFSVTLKWVSRLAMKKHGVEAEKTDVEILKMIHDEIQKSNKSEGQLKAAIDDLKSAIAGDGDTSVTSQLKSLRSDIRTDLGPLKELNTHLDELKSNIASNHSVIVEQFEGFAEILKKSNTEALVEVMKQVTKDINDQLSSLINKLVQENFDRLNDAVGKMVDWQTENKIAMDTLSLQLKEAVNQVGLLSEYTKSLVGDNSDLKLIVEELKRVLLEDQRFTQIVELLNQSLVEINSSSNTLKDWIDGQSEYNEKFTDLIDKLDEVSSIEDLSHEFWKNTQKGFDDSSKILGDGVEKFNNTIKSLDEKIGEIDQVFKDQLNNTLLNLDGLISAAFEKLFPDTK